MPLQLFIEAGEHALATEAENTSPKIFCVHIDYKLKIDTHIESPCKKVGKRLHVLSRIIQYVSTNLAQLLMRSLIMSQFSYCPLI